MDFIPRRTVEAAHDFLQRFLPLLESTCRARAWPCGLSVGPFNVDRTPGQPDFILPTTDSSRAGVQQGLQVCVLRDSQRLRPLV